MRNGKHSERGLLSLEACIAVTIFTFLMLFMYSFFVIFEARNTIGHSVLATANSLSLDAYSNTKYGESGTIAQIFHGIYGAVGANDSDFVDSGAWYDDATDDTGALSSSFESAIRTRFLAYLGGGDRQRAGEVLKRYHIQDGVEGLDFSGSYVDGEKKLHLSVKYTIEYEFQVFNLNVLKMEQKACSKLWI